MKYVKMVKGSRWSDRVLKRKEWISDRILRVVLCTRVQRRTLGR